MPVVIVVLRHVRAGAHVQVGRELEVLIHPQCGVHRVELGVRGKNRFPLFGWKGLAAADHLANVISLPPNGRAAVAEAVQHVFVDECRFSLCAQ